MKVIFLDVDGVLNSNSTNAISPNGYVGVSDKYVKLLRRIVNETDAKVVLSSDWRLDHGPDYKYLTNKLWYKGGIRLFSETPNIGWEWRGNEIKTWLSEHEDVENYVILDDISFPDFMGDLEDHLIETDPTIGLTDEDVELAVGVLNK